jgi:hypothetical protein
MGIKDMNLKPYKRGSNPILGRYPDGRVKPVGPSNKNPFNVKDINNHKNKSLKKCLNLTFKQGTK